METLTQLINQFSALADAVINAAPKALLLAGTVSGLCAHVAAFVHTHKLVDLIGGNYGRAQNGQPAQPTDATR